MKKMLAAAALGSALVSVSIAADVNDWSSHDNDAVGHEGNA
jgi:opacity protein-like surface antigen